MRRFVLTAAVLSSTAFLPLACNVEQPDLPKENVEKDDAAIIGGTTDTTHKAVVALASNNGLCSGTIIAKNGSTGWVLTAGHCSGMQIAMQANNYQSCFNMSAGCEAVYDVVADTPHPNWNGDAGDGYDFRILQISGVTASTPVIPAAQNPDGLANGSPIEAVGYGVTESNDNNSVRMHVTETVDDLSSLMVAADQTDGTGSCSGDSGGPILFNGKVVGVTSYGDQNCSQYGVYGRVQAVYATWIAGIIGQVVTPTCDDCFLSAQNGTCASQDNACWSNQDCVDLNECFGGCNGNQTCLQNCVNAHPTGWNLYSALIDCACNACATECENECGGSSTTTTTTSGPGPQTSSAEQASSAAAGMGGFGDGGSGEGAADSDDGGTKKKKKKDNDDDEDETETIDSCACSTPGSPASGGLSGLFGLVGLGALAGALVRRRRR